MAETDVAVAIIQLVALFLPAWAVVMQGFNRLVRETDLTQRPTLISLFALGFTLSILSLYLFGRAGHDILSFFVSEGYVTGSGPLAQALINSGLGALAFVSMGAVVMAIIGFRHIPHREVALVFGLGSVYWVVMFVGWRYNRPVLMMIAVAVVFGVSSFAIAYLYPSPSETEDLEPSKN